MPGDPRTGSANGLERRPLEPWHPPAFEAATESEIRAACLVAVEGPLGTDDHQALEAIGLEVLEYVPTHLYLCSGSESALAAAGGLGFVTGLYSFDSLAVAAELQDARRGGLESAVRLTVEVVLYPGFDPELAARVLVERAGASDLELGRDKVRATVAAAALDRIAGLAFVRHVEPWTPPELASDVACGLVRAKEVLAELGLGGEGEMIAVADTGLDLGSASDVHPAFTGRVVGLEALGRSGRADDPNGHGTHVAAIAVGDGTSSEAGGTVRGSAPAARLFFQSLQGPTLDAPLAGLPADLRDLLEPAYVAGARIHNDSWVRPRSSNRYIKPCQEIDDFVHHHRDLVVVAAAGNEGRVDGGGPRDGTVRPPSLARNAIAVGMCESRRPEQSRAWSAEPRWRDAIDPDAVLADGFADDPEGVAPISGRGPTRDGRVKPDLVAPGTAILSAHSRAAGNAGADWGTSSDPAYAFLGGSSMAAPLVAGCAAVVRQFLRRDHGLEAPSAALVKALLINGAIDLAGQYSPSEAPEVPNAGEGWGRVDLRSSIAPQAPLALTFFDEGDELLPDERKPFELRTLAAGLPLKVTLVWTDPPGEALQNDLDLIVRSPTEERHGNRPPGDTGFDRVNNVEQVLWPGFGATAFTVEVHAKRLTDPRQSFALVIRGAL